MNIPQQIQNLLEAEGYKVKVSDTTYNRENAFLYQAEKGNEAIEIIYQSK